MSLPLLVGTISAVGTPTGEIVALGAVAGGVRDLLGPQAGTSTVSVPGGTVSQGLTPTAIVEVLSA